MLSIIIPAYNSASTIERCLASVCNSTFTDLEILCVDDGSTDDTLEKLHAFALKDSRVIVLHQENGGVSSARNHGLQCAKGDYIAFVDSDDYVLPHMYETMVNAIMLTSADVVCCNYFHGTNNGGYIRQLSHNYAEDIVVGHENISERIIANMIFGDGNTIGLPSPFNKLYRAKLICKNSISFDTDRFHGEDWLFNLHIFNNANVVKFISDPLYVYVQHKGSLVSRFNPNVVHQMMNNDKIFKTVFNQFNYDGFRYAKCIMNAAYSIKVSLYSNVRNFTLRKQILKTLNNSDVYRKCYRIYSQHVSVQQKIKDRVRLFVGIVKKIIRGLPYTF